GLLALEPADQRLQPPAQRRERRPQLVARRGHELVLQPAQATLRDLADHHHALRFLPVLDRPAVRFEPAALTLRADRDGELHVERFAAGRALLWRLFGW